MSSARLILARARLVQGAEAPVPSPCLSVCRMEQGSALCAGCFRTLDEIAAWGSLPDRSRRAVWQQIEQRARAAVDDRKAAP